MNKAYVMFSNQDETGFSLEIPEEKDKMIEISYVQLKEKYEELEKTFEQCDIEFDGNEIYATVHDFDDAIKIKIGKRKTCGSIKELAVDGNIVQIFPIKAEYLSLNCEEAEIVRCHMGLIDVGNIRSVRLEERLKAKPNEHGMKKLYIRESSIGKVDLSISINAIELCGSSIEYFTMFGFGDNLFRKIHRLDLVDHSEIGKLDIHGKIKVFRLLSGSIDNMYAKVQCRIGNFEVREGYVANAFGFRKTCFDNIRKDAWTLIALSAKNNNDYVLRGEANYQLAKYGYKGKGKLSQIGGKIFDLTTGFGYKPFNALISCLFVGVLGTILLMIIGLFTASKNTIMDCAIIAFSAILGQSGLTVDDGWRYVVTCVEYGISVILFAMFVNALYVKYRD